MSSRSSRWHRPAQHFPLVPHLAIVPILLATATAIALFVHSDVNAALLWSQCHSHSLLPGLGRLPILGTPLCFLVSFMHAALDAIRGTAVMGVVMAFVGALLTVSTVESARIVNANRAVVSSPTPSWLVFNLLGGALMWELVIVPAHIMAAKSRDQDDDDDDDEDNDDDDDDRDAVQTDQARRVPETEVLAIPIAVALGFYLPSAVMLGTSLPVAIGVWFFFPILVSLVRQLARFLLSRMAPFRSGPLIHLESHAECVAAVYALPVLCSLLAHGFVIASMSLSDDRKQLTRSAGDFIALDFLFVGLTVLYWIFVEAGWRAALAAVLSSVVFGPGAGVALAWVYREKLLTSDLVRQLRNQVDEVENDERGTRLPDEQTALLH